MILIYPPVAKASEPPAGIAKLSGELKFHGVRHTVVDANIEGLLFLLGETGRIADSACDRWSLRALRNSGKNLASLRDRRTYHNIGRYTRAVLDLNRILDISSGDRNVIPGLANYRHRSLSPLRSRDLLRASEEPEVSPFFPYFSKRLTGLCEKEQPSLVGFSLNYLSQALPAFAMAGFLRRNFPGLKIVFGGGLVTSWMKRPGWKNPFSGLADHIVAGPGEAALLSLAGIRTEGSDCGTPHYALFPVRDYLSPGPVLPYSASSGCYWNRCSFCPERAEDNRYVQVSPEKALSDVAALTNETEPVLIHFLDNALSPALLNALAENPPGPPWYGFVRIDRSLADIDFCSALKRAGCVMLKLGLESGDQSVLDRMQKGVDLTIASQALKALRKAGIAAYVYLLFGTPAETLDAARKTLEFTVSNSGEIGFLNLAVFAMPVGSPETEAKATRSFYEGDLSLYTDFVHPEGWDRRQVRRFLENEFRKNKAVSSIVKRDPPVFTSNHAPFFVMG
ncbi:MAG: radical SAM protein [Nitrospirae bacterium]|nr:radical SAM protein [Nitrospirota bacterium]